MTLVKKKTFGAVVRDRRIDLDLSQYQLAEMLGVTQASVSRWEADISFPKPPELSPLAAALEIPLEELLRPLEEMSREPGRTTREQLQDIDDRLRGLETLMETLLDALKPKGTRRPKN